MKKKKQHDGSGLMILLTVAIGVVAVAFIAVGALLFAEGEKIPVRTDVSETEKQVIVSLTVTERTEKTEKSKESSVTSETYVTSSETTTETSVTSSETTEETTADTFATEDTISASDTSAETDAPETVSSAEETTVPADLPYELSYFSNDLFIGDSIYTGLYLYEYFPESQVFAKLGMNPQSVRTISVNGYTAKQKIAEMKPERVYIMLGTNGLAYMSASLMANEMKAFVGELLAESPESRIYIVSIPPVTYAHELKGNETMDMVNKYNSLLESAAAESGAGFLDLCSELKNDKGYFSSLYAEADGMHFLGSAYKRMLGFFFKETQ